jgi:hypothetical protein
MPRKLLRWIVRNRPEIEVVATVLWMIAGEIRERITSKRRRKR